MDDPRWACERGGSEHDGDESGVGDDGQNLCPVCAVAEELAVNYPYDSSES